MLQGSGTVMVKCDQLHTGLGASIKSLGFVVLDGLSLPLFHLEHNKPLFFGPRALAKTIHHPQLLFMRIFSPLLCTRTMKWKILAEEGAKTNSQVLLAVHLVLSIQRLM